MDATTLFLFGLASAALVAIPGPNLLYIVTRSLTGGKRIGLACALGVETGTLVWIGTVAVGLSTVIASSAVALVRAPHAQRAQVEIAPAQPRACRPLAVEGRTMTYSDAAQRWASLVEEGNGVTLAGTSILTFDGDGLVVDQWDTWNTIDERREPPEGWGR